MDNKTEYKIIIAEEEKYRGKDFLIVKQTIEYKSGDTEGSFIMEVVRRTPGVRAIIVNLDLQLVLLTKEYRSELSNWDYRLPGGKIFDRLDKYLECKTNETELNFAAEKAVDDEVLEEAGLKVLSKSFLHKSIAGASVSWDLLYFVITEFEKVEQLSHEDEIIYPEWKEIDVVKQMCFSGAISEERSALVLLRFLETLKI